MTTTYQDVLITEERLELLYNELLSTPDNAECDTLRLQADIARDEALLARQCAACGITYRTREDALAWWDSLPMIEEVHAHG
jgi:hypothetical protein